ncbi:DNA phosphorothioation-dependent restriction protein DptF [Methylophaga pinxianii]|uniref:DNA phosphorothioation-dependent restriction protein DptF n=1 Tax=Methylophaga pinxianii TaxID=2881052 RepID=UPI001CF2AADE|nr:DNA phosphorothioation-dependent restriction protein DptF [Methylophaga pinxianii]MCB2425502.1 DNA phosphorothioation-dependent restriction protein DptF [Methylophaga pinxianii]UPH46141.1 DNA phosphorothioation-dependent restriction protein DptF [Methylophaga pinxianii]
MEFNLNSDQRSFQNALMVLSKASPEAVSVERKFSKQNKYKNYLYIYTDVETDFRNELEKLDSGEILFLCGSSGDGKSEIITKYSSNEKYYHEIDFHLDATHSFKPHQTAIQALDERFKLTLNTGRPLVIGINVGMLGNYAKRGDDEFNSIKTAINSFLEDRKDQITNEFIFIDFEDYPKFKFDEDTYSSSFAKPFFQKLTHQDENNPFYLLYKKELQQHGHTKLSTNFHLLSLTEVQDVLVELLLKARLICSCPR